MISTVSRLNLSLLALVSAGCSLISAVGGELPVRAPAGGLKKAQEVKP